MSMILSGIDAFECCIIYKIYLHAIFYHTF